MSLSVKLDYNKNEQMDRSANAYCPKCSFQKMIKDDIQNNQSKRLQAHCICQDAWIKKQT